MTYHFKTLTVKKKKKRTLIIWNITELPVAMVIEFKTMAE